MLSEGIARDGCYRGCLKVCRQGESGGHILGGSLHRSLDVKKQYIARYDKAMRVVVQAFTKGGLGSLYLIADVGRARRLKGS